LNGPDVISIQDSSKTGHSEGNEDIGVGEKAWLRERP